MGRGPEGRSPWAFAGIFAVTSTDEGLKLKRGKLQQKGEKGMQCSLWRLFRTRKMLY